MNSDKILCARGVWDSSIPGIKFDDQGVCNHCRRVEGASIETAAKKAEYRERLDGLISETRGKAPVYDAIMAYSGGKDSSYTLKLLREQYNLRILAMTFDNHFVSPGAWENISIVSDFLNVDAVRFRIPWTVAKHLFSLTAQNSHFELHPLIRLIG